MYCWIKWIKFWPNEKVSGFFFFPTPRQVDFGLQNFDFNGYKSVYFSYRITFLFLAFFRKEFKNG